MSAESLAALLAAIFSGLAALVALAVALVLSKRLREVREIVSALDTETVPLVRDARVMMDQAAVEMERVGDVLATAEAVSGTVDSASRLAYRAFANPVVKTIAFTTGTTNALRRLLTPRRTSRAAARAQSETSAPRATREHPPTRHRRPRRVRVPG